MTPLRFLAGLAVLISATLPAGAQIGSPACQTDLAAVDASFEETLTRLGTLTETSSVEEKCAVFRHHVEVMQNGVAVFDRCMEEGHDKRENIGQLAVSIDDFHTVMDKAGCR